MALSLKTRGLFCFTKTQVAVVNNGNFAHGLAVVFGDIAKILSCQGACQVLTVFFVCLSSYNYETYHSFLRLKFWK